MLRPAYAKGMALAAPPALRLDVHSETGATNVGSEDRRAMKMIHPDQIRAEFERLVELVEKSPLKKLDEGFFTRDEPAIWMSVGRLARLVYVNAMMSGGELKSAFEDIVWGLARMEIRTGDGSTPSIPEGAPVIMNPHKWNKARDRFAKALSSWPL